MSEECCSTNVLGQLPAQRQQMERRQTVRRMGPSATEADSMLAWQCNTVAV
jgi:hypothetical protein